MKSPVDSAARVAAALEVLAVLDQREIRLVEAHLLVQRLRGRGLALLESVLPDELCDEPRFLAVDLSVLVPWTEEQTPSGIRFRGDEVAPVLLADGSTLVIMTAPEGVWIERIADEARGYRLLGRGFWRDCEIQEAVYFARDAWELA